jgi:hypothetical protein
VDEMGRKVIFSKIKNFPPRRSSLLRDSDEKASKIIFLAGVPVGDSSEVEMLLS